MNTHEHISIEVLADYAEGLLGDADSTSVAEHLASCSDCQAEADLLVSVSAILAADDPGPMPEHYATRIDAALAELAAAEPVTPKRTGAAAAGGGATVIDLASRRRFTPAARVTSVAASLVLLIGGVALGMQALNTDESGGPGLGASENPNATPSIDSASAAYRASLYYAQKAAAKPTGKKAKKGKNGAIIDKTDGTVYLRNKVYFADGSIVVHKANGDTQVMVASTKAGEEPVVKTFKRNEVPPGRPVVAPKSTPVATPTPTPASTPKTTPTVSTAATVDAWVENTGETYTEDNFATKVRTLLRDAGETTSAVSAQSVSDGTADSSAPSPTSQNRVSSQAVRSDESTADRGPAPADVVARVKRCATQLKLTPVVAADAGIWKGQSATILVVRQADAKQATGYVVLGDCTKDAPATQDSIAWFAPVDVPTDAAEEPAPSPSPSPTANPSGEGSSNVSPNVSSGVSDTVTPSVTSSLSPATAE